MTDEPFVDAHVHFWDRSVSELQWVWLDAGFSGYRFDSADGYRGSSYLPPDLMAEADGTGLAGVVGVHCAEPIPDPEVETAWLERVADRYGLPDVTVGRCELDRSGTAGLLERHRHHRRFRGVRDLTAYESLAVDRAFGALDAAGRLGISVEVRRPHDQLDVVVEIARRWPDIVVVLSHACLPSSRDAASLAEWSAALHDLADRTQSVVCKISAVAGRGDPDWTTASIRPWILAAVEAFGPDRCMLGSNWPVDRRYGSYRRLIDGYRDVLSVLDPAERQAILAGTARRVYRIPD
ncbi:MAG: amidohydrolase family protein [Acidimicrobiaceae bacterium]|nr:amidohydrolase family protein [Acidimicrobiaceae bacterium]MYG99399.1 amidohydrolase family protein [Acidimicrobiaceae bacterium]MYL04634.1 amidohydrolase family protein [Acidimicrobiaceae bacterium]